MDRDKGKVVLSLFNGMNTLRQAFENLGMKIDKYYSSEIKKPAITLTQHYFTDTIQLGNIENWRQWDIDWKSIDFIGSGSPCQDLSIAGKQKGINGSRSSLFWVFIEILNHVKKLNPSVIFLQENVGTAPKKDVGIMSRALGVYPVKLNSKLVTAQLRCRYYWTNIRIKKEGLFGDIISDIPQPKDKKIMFKDIIESGYVKRAKALAILEREGTSNVYKDYDSDKFQKHAKKRASEGHLNIVYIENKEIRVKTNTVKGYDILTKNDCLNLAFPTSTTRGGRVTKGKSLALLQSNEPLYCIDQEKVRLLNKSELCKLQGFPGDYCDILTRNQAASLLGDGWTLPVIEYILSFLKL